MSFYQLNKEEEIWVIGINDFILDYPLIFRVKNTSYKP